MDLTRRSLSKRLDVRGSMCKAKIDESEAERVFIQENHRATHEDLIGKHQKRKDNSKQSEVGRDDAKITTQTRRSGPESSG